MTRREYNGKSCRKNFYKYNMLNNKLLGTNKIKYKENFISSQNCLNCPQISNNSCYKCCPSSPSYPDIGGGNNCITPYNKWNFAKH